MNYIAIFLFMGFQVVWADGGMTSDSPPVNNKAQPMTSAGVEKMIKNHEEIRALFLDIKDKLDFIGEKYLAIEGALKRKDTMVSCSVFHSIKEDIYDVDKQLNDAKAKGLSNNELSGRLRSYKITYNKSYIYYMEYLKNKGINCE